MATTEIFSVSEYLDKLNNLLKTERAKVVGEVSGVQMYEGRSYLYFSIKDKKDQSTVKCFMWKRDFSLSGVNLKDGLEVVITAYPNIYKPNGGMTLQVEMVELVGEGALQKAYEELKKKLTLEGLLDQSKKREIPNYPHKIGIITSKSGAVINDFLSNIGKYGYEILFVDSKVEGQDAIKDLLSAVNTLKSKDLDVLVVMRGGGSLESFQAFNNEILVRAIANFPAPVLTGIGHDKDLPLVSMVSDKNVSTPTAVANLLNSTWSEANSKVSLYQERIFSGFQAKVIDVFRDAEHTLSLGIGKIEATLVRIADKIRVQQKEIIRGFENISKEVAGSIIQFQRTIESFNPERQLGQGYSIVRSNGKVLRKVADVKIGSQVDITVSDGIIETKVQKLNNN